MLLNKERALAVMTDHNLDALVASTRENVTYASNLDSHLLYITGNLAFVVLTRDDFDNASALIIPGTGLGSLAGSPTWIKNIHVTQGFWWWEEPGATLAPLEQQFKALSEQATHHDANSLQVLARVLKQRGLNRARVGFDDVRYGQQLQGQPDFASLQVVDALGLFQTIRVVKTEEEIARLRRAADINEATLQRILEVARPGVSLAEVYREAEQTFLNRGGTPLVFSIHNGVRASQMSYPPHWSLSKIPQDAAAAIVLQAGELVRCDIGGTYHHYWADTGFTLSLGEPSPKAKTYFAAVRAALDVGRDLLKPGAVAKDVFQAMVATAKKTIPHFERFHCGHSIGIEYYDGVKIRPDSEQRLEENMVINLEVPYFELGFGSVHLEETFLITATGCETLTPIRRELFEV